MLVPPSADPHLKAPLGDDVDGRGDFGEVGRVAVAHAGTHLSEPHAPGHPGKGRHQRPRLVGRFVAGHRHGVEVVVDPDGLPLGDSVGASREAGHHAPVLSGIDAHEIHAPALRDEQSKPHTRKLSDSRRVTFHPVTSRPKIAVVGTSYVGLSLAVLLARHNAVTGFDIDADRIAALQQRRSPLIDPDIEHYLAHEELDLRFTLDKHEAYAGAEFVIIATPTDYDARTNYFDTSSVEQVIGDVRTINPEAVMVIKSTIPVGFVRQMRTRLGTDNIIFPRVSAGTGTRRQPAPFPIVVGDVGARPTVRRTPSKAALDPDVPVLLTARRRPRRSSCSPTPTSRCASPTSTSSTPMPSRGA